jgi:hypothetical protein
MKIEKRKEYYSIQIKLSLNNFITVDMIKINN